MTLETAEGLLKVKGTQNCEIAVREANHPFCSKSQPDSFAGLWRKRNRK